MQYKVAFKIFIFIYLFIYFVTGVLDEVILEAQLFEVDTEAMFIQDKTFITGHHNYRLEMQENIPVVQSKVIYKINCDQLLVLCLF